MQDAKAAATPMDPGSYAALTVQRLRADTEMATMENLPYHKLIGMLLSLSTHTSPEILFATAVLARHMAAARSIHCNAA